MKSLLALCLVIAAPLSGQITSLAINADASTLQFASRYTLPSDTAPGGRIYQYRPGKPDLILAAPDLEVVLQPVAPYVSDDGLTTGWFTYQTCFGSCMIFTPRGGVTLTRNGRKFQAQGQTIRISRNGRWLFDSGFPNFDSRLVDIDTGATTKLPGINELHPVHSVSDDGTLVTSSLMSAPPGTAPLPNPNAIRVIEGSKNTEINFPDAIVSAAITPSGHRLFALTAKTLYEVERTSLTLRELYTTTSTPLVRFDISASGDRVLIQSGTTLLLLENSVPRTLYTAPESVTQILLSADGNTSLFTTEANRLIRITANATEELYPAFPSRAGQFGAGSVPGSLVRFSGGPFTENQVLSADGRDFPLIATSKDFYEAQIPWDFAVNTNHTFTLSAPDTPFLITGRISLSAAPSPAIYWNYNYETSRTEVKAAQADFQSLVTRDNPAPAGSTIHFWLTGLGPLDQPLATGQRGPANPPAKPLVPFACYIFGNADSVRGLELPFVAYAPGLLGVYQVDAVIPSDWPAGTADLACAVGSNPPTAAASVYVAPSGMRLSGSDR